MRTMKKRPETCSPCDSCNLANSYNLFDTFNCFNTFIKSICGLALLLFLAGCTPQGARALLQGKRLMEQGRYSQAVEKLKTATGLLATNAQAWNYLGLAYHYAGQAADAQKAYQRALALNRDLTEAHYNLGCLWLGQSKLDSAKTELTAYTLRRANSLEGFLKLGTAQLRSHELNGAERTFNDALRLNPRNPEALNDLGLVRLQRGRAAEAEQYFNAAQTQQPDYAPAVLNAALVAHQHLKDRQLALRKYRQYLALKPPPEHSEAVQALVRQLEQDLHPAPRPAATNTIAQTNLNAPAPPATNLARIAQAPKPEPATNVPKSAATVAPPLPTNVEVVMLPAEPVFKPAHDLPSPPAPIQSSLAQPSTATTSPPATAGQPHAARGGFLERMNPLSLFRSEAKPASKPTPLPPLADSPHPEPAQAPVNDTAAVTEPSTPPNPAPARYAYRSPLKPVPGNRPEAERWFAQGRQAQRAGRLPEALQAYQMATQLDAAYFEAHFDLGLAAADAGNLPAALAAYENALALRPDSLDARYNFALALKQANYPLDAANEFEKVLASYPNETRAHLALANLYAQQLRRPARARQHYVKVLEGDPGHPQASLIHYWLVANPP